MAVTYARVPKTKPGPRAYIPENAQLAQVPQRDPRDPRGQDYLAPTHVKLPPPPTYQSDEDRTLHDEQQVMRTELLMLKGIRDRRQLMALLSVDSQKTMARYVERVYARWEMQGVARDLKRHRGEALARFDAIDSELWALTNNSEDERVKMVGLRNILDLQSYRAQMLGLTPKVIERMSSTDVDEGDLTFTRRVTAHNVLSRVAARMLEKIEQRTGRGDDREAG